MRPLMIAALTLSCVCTQASAQTGAEEQKLKRREDLSGASTVGRAEAERTGGLWVVPAGTKIPIQLRQAVSTKNAQPGDPIYAQTTFPVIVNDMVMIPAGTFVKGIVDSSKRAGRIKGKAELQFHLTSLIYPNGYTLEMAAAVDQVPGSVDTHMREPGRIERDAAKGDDLKKVADAAATGAQIGALGGAASGNIRGLGIGGIGGIAAGTLIGILARGADVRFEIGSGVEVALNRAIAVDGERVTRGSLMPASSTPSPVIMSPATQR